MAAIHALTTRSALMPAMLAGAWREGPSPYAGSGEELKLMTPLLMETGAGALAWRRIRHSSLNSTPAAEQLHDAYRLYKLMAVVYRREMAEIFRLLRSNGIESVVVKGWSIARHYGEADTRPCGDVDLCVRKEEHGRAREVLKSRSGFAHDVDLHMEFQRLDDRSFEELFARSEMVELEGEEIRVLKPEDHLRVLCYHFLREGGWRPLWLCDIAALLESRPAGFDWDLCLGGKRRRADWVACTLRLAHQLIGAEIEETPGAVRAAKLPKWLVPSILHEWEARSMSQRHRTPMSAARSHPLYTLRGLRHHWPTPVEATVVLGQAFNEMPRLPLQVCEAFARTAHLLVRLPGLLRDRRA